MQADLGVPPPASTGPGDAQRNQRYAYLVARLRNRQMTMEEATELFGLMQVMLRQSEMARQALMRMPPPAPSTGLTSRERPPVPAAPAGGVSDDFFLLGILAMGAGAGLLAAMSKRLQDLPPPAASERRGRSDAGAPTE